MSTYALTGYFVRGVADLPSLIAGVLASLRDQKVVHAEITISIPEYTRQGISLSDICTCLDETSTLSGIRVQWIVDPVRGTSSQRPR